MPPRLSHFTCSYQTANTAVTMQPCTNITEPASAVMGPHCYATWIFLTDITNNCAFDTYCTWHAHVNLAPCNGQPEEQWGSELPSYSEAMPVTFRTQEKMRSAGLKISHRCIEPCATHPQCMPVYWGKALSTMSQGIVNQFLASLVCYECQKWTQETGCLIKL